MVFIATCAYPYKGNPEDMVVFSTLFLARKWVVEGIKKYLSEVLEDKNDTYHSQEWRECVSECIEACEEEKQNLNAIDGETFFELLSAFDELDRQYETYTIAKRQVQTKL